MTAPDDFLAALGREAMRRDGVLDSEGFLVDPAPPLPPTLGTLGRADYARAHGDERCRCKGQPLYRLARPDGGHWTWHSMGCPQREE